MNENKVFFGNENLGELSAIEHCIFEPTHPNGHSNEYFNNQLSLNEFKCELENKFTESFQCSIITR